MRRLLAGSAALALVAMILLPAAGVAAKVTCDPDAQAPGWQSMAYARVPLGLSEGVHPFRIDFEFTDAVTGEHVVDYMEGSIEVSTERPVIGGTMWVTPWALFAPQPPHERYPLWVMNPMQPAAFVLGWANLKVDSASGDALSRQAWTQSIHDTVQTVSLDGGPAIPMHFHQAADVCIWTD
jgi:hypothetical protein